MPFLGIEIDGRMACRALPLTTRDMIINNLRENRTLRVYRQILTLLFFFVMSIAPSLGRGVHIDHRDLISIDAAYGSSDHGDHHDDAGDSGGDPALPHEHGFAGHSHDTFSTSSAFISVDQPNPRQWTRARETLILTDIRTPLERPPRALSVF